MLVISMSAVEVGGVFPKPWWSEGVFRLIGRSRSTEAVARDGEPSSGRIVKGFRLVVGRALKCGRACGRASVIINTGGDR